MANPIYVPTPSSEPYVGGLFGAATIVDGNERAAAMGAQFEAVPCTFPNPAPGSCWKNIGTTTVASTKSTTAPGFGATILNFPLYAGVQCFLNANSDYDQKAQELLLAGEAVAVEKVFYQWLVDNAGTAVAAPASGGVVSAFGVAESLLGGQLPTLGVIHANRYITNLARSAHLVTLGTDEPLLTIQGTPVANGGGYTPNPAAPVADRIFATGAITIYRGDIQVTRATDQTHNREMAIAERGYAIAINCNYAKLITFS
jgi:hypothetical protein